MLTRELCMNATPSTPQNEARAQELVDTRGKECHPLEVGTHGLHASV